MNEKTPEEQMSEAFSALAGEMGKAAAAYQAAMGDWLKAWQAPLKAATPDIKINGNGATPKIDPQKVVQGQLELMRDYQQLWLGTMQRLTTQGPAEPVVTPEAGDNRFKDPAWSDNPMFDFIKQSYLLNARWLRKTLSEVDGIDPDTARKLDFYGRTLVDAMAPTNFPLTNPVVLRETADSKGENLRKGFSNFLEDMKSGGGALRPRHTDMNAFEVGRNIAVSAGAVVFQNELFQLLQYEPTTETVYKRPLLIVPPWINKFYILDLRPDNSFIRWATAQGYTVFVMSWVNPDERHKDLGFADYIKQGIFTALDAVTDATGERQMSAIGYCIGGTLLAMALAYMAAKGDDRITSATFFAAM
jgi:polyhydroxyalkanoate synthase subunit PhaC